MPATHVSHALANEAEDYDYKSPLLAMQDSAHHSTMQAALWAFVLRIMDHWVWLMGILLMTEPLLDYHIQGFKNWADRYVSRHIRSQVAISVSVFSIFTASFLAFKDEYAAREAANAKTSSVQSEAVFWRYRANGAAKSPIFITVPPQTSKPAPSQPPVFVLPRATPPTSLAPPTAQPAPAPDPEKAATIGALNDAIRKITAVVDKGEDIRQTYMNTHGEEDFKKEYAEWWSASVDTLSKVDPSVEAQFRQAHTSTVGFYAGTSMVGSGFVLDIEAKNSILSNILTDLRRERSAQNSLENIKPIRP